MEFVETTFAIGTCDGKPTEKTISIVGRWPADWWNTDRHPELWEAYIRPAFEQLRQRAAAATVACLALLLLCGCAIRRPVPGHLNYVVDGRTSHMSMQLVNCDAASPPNCEKRLVSYDRGAEMLLRPQVTK